MTKLIKNSLDIINKEDSLTSIKTIHVLLYNKILLYTLYKKHFRDSKIKIKILGTNLGLRCFNQLTRFVKTHKDKKNENNMFVYKIYSKDCEVSYVGQIKK